jgi:hypothetical protein
MPTLTVRVSTVVVKEYKFEGISFDDEQDYCDDAKEQQEADLQSDDWDTSHSDVRVNWEGEEG